MDLRCPNGIKFAEMNDGLIEVKCRSTRCGAGAGVVVLHQFDALTGELVRTNRFREVAGSKATRQDRRSDGAQHDSAAVRYP